MPSTLYLVTTIVSAELIKQPRLWVTGWSFCTKASERVYITASGYEIEFGETRGL